MSYDMEMEEYHEDEKAKKDEEKLMKKELQKLADEINEEAKKVVKDYAKNPSKMSGSIHHIHENSPFLKEKHERLITFGDKQMKIKPDAD
tara:strand:+ start:132 stop:401 length:270 start_codon:yes stop_codon:yes gene_type:complete